MDYFSLRHGYPIFFQYAPVTLYRLQDSKEHKYKPADDIFPVASNGTWCKTLPHPRHVSVGPRKYPQRAASTPLLTNLRFHSELNVKLELRHFV